MLRMVIWNIITEHDGYEFRLVICNILYITVNTNTNINIDKVIWKRILYNIIEILWLFLSHFFSPKYLSLSVYSE